MQMREPAAAMQQLLRNRLVLVLATTTDPGGTLRRRRPCTPGGEWLEQENGTWWFLLAPTEEFRAVIERFKIPPASWPFTIENALSAALRREAKAAGVYWFSGDPQPELLRETAIAKRMFQAFPEITEDDDAYFYLMAPHYEAKDASTA
jgi:hypothetical protein